jgi:hypothetical protein
MQIVDSVIAMRSKYREIVVTGGFLGRPLSIP